MTGVQGYWRDHSYFRQSVEEVDHFVGWLFLVDLVDRADSPRDRALVSALFETGGLISETLQLRTNTLDTGGDFIIVRGMPRLGRKQCDTPYPDHLGLTGRKHFPIPTWEPLVEPLISYLEQIQTKEKEKEQGKEGEKTEETDKEQGKEEAQKEDKGRLLFPSKRSDGHLHRSWAYRIIRELGKQLDPPRHSYSLWFRKQRELQLRSEYGFNDTDIADFFTFEQDKTPQNYFHKEMYRIMDKMLEA